MSILTVHIDAVGLCGPGLESWNAGKAVIGSGIDYVSASTIIVASNLLPTAERRRVGTAVKLALACATDALSESIYKASELLSIFSSSGGDGDNCHIICESLASQDRMISPTRFTNSVHNAPSGYWGIACQAKPASTSLCAFDGSFSAGFLEACAQSITAQSPVLLIAYDTPYPEPLRAKRPISHSFGIALVISHQLTNASLATVHMKLGKATPTVVQNADLELLRQNVPAARCLPALQALASGCGRHDLVLDLFDNQQLILDLEVLR